MPSLLTHYFFAKDFFESNEDSCSFLKGNKEYFLLGEQGPDPYFFYGLYPKKGLHISHALKKYGSHIHKSNGEIYFKLLLEEKDSIQDEKERNAFMSFIYGQFSHYVLDSTTHPYIFYFSGFDKDGNLTKEYHYRHAHFEARIDSVLIDRYEASQNLKRRPQDILCTDKEVLELISRHQDNVMQKIFSNKLRKNMYKDAVECMVGLYSFTNDKSNFRNKLLGKSMLAGLIIPKSTSDRLLNEEKKTWVNPVTNTKYDLSFVELMEKARYKMNKSALVFKDDIVNDEIKAFFSSINFSGVPVDSKLTYQDESEEFLK